MHPFCRPLIGIAALLLAGGCTDTNPDNDPMITDGLAVEVSRGSLMVATLATELALTLSEFPEPGDCPAATQDGDTLLLDYAGGCVPSSALTEDMLSGSVAITLAGGTGVFVGDLGSLGFVDLPILGAVSGQVSRAGDLVIADIEFSNLTWTEDGLSNSLDTLFEVSIDGDDILLNLVSGSFLRGSGAPFRVDLEEIVPAPQTMGSCWIPTRGRAELAREDDTATLTYSEVAHASGEVSVTFGSRDPITVEPCP